MDDRKARERLYRVKVKGGGATRDRLRSGPRERGGTCEDHPRPGCDRAWRESLTPWAERHLAALYRQGRGLPRNTNGGSDLRWCQAGVKTRDSYGTWRRTSRHGGHEAVVIQPTDYGFRQITVRRRTAWSIDIETGIVTER